MDELDGYYAEKDGVQVIVLKIPYSGKSYDDMLKIAINLLINE